MMAPFHVKITPELADKIGVTVALIISLEMWLLFGS
jgi:hypothetical protein